MRSWGSGLLGLLFIRVMLIAAGITVIWTLWYGFYSLAVVLILALGYFFYLTWKPVTIDENLIDPEYWED